MRSVGLWRWYINITVTILDIIRRPVFYLKHGGCSYLTGNTLLLCYESKRLMRSIGLWRWYINITIKILDIIRRPVFYLKHDGCSYLTGNTFLLCYEHNRLMRSIGIWRWYINIPITRYSSLAEFILFNTILDILHRPVFYLKQTTAANISQGIYYVPATSPTA
jgi:hypothetical protein